MDNTLATVLAMPSSSFLSSNQQGRGGPQLVASPIYPLQPSLAGNAAGKLSLVTLAALVVALVAFAYWTKGHNL